MIDLKKMIGRKFGVLGFSKCKKNKIPKISKHFTLKEASPTLNRINAKYFSNFEEARPILNSTNPALERQLYDFNENLMSEV